MTHDEGNVESRLSDAFKTHILLIADEDAIRRYLRIILKDQGFDVHEAKTAKDGLTQMDVCHADVILLDFPLPDSNDISLISDILKISHVLILVLSSQDDAERKIKMLDAGAEDYIVKPFITGELLARIRVALRRNRRIDHVDAFRSDDLEVDFIRRMVTVNKKIVDLTMTEYELLRFLIIHPDEPVTHQQLWQAIRHDIEAFEAHTVRVHLSNLRRKLELDPANPKHILTEVGIGYRFQTERAISQI